MTAPYYEELPVIVAEAADVLDQLDPEWFWHVPTDTRLHMWNGARCVGAWLAEDGYFGTTARRVAEAADDLSLWEAFGSWPGLHALWVSEIEYRQWRALGRRGERVDA